MNAFVKKRTLPPILTSARFYFLRRFLLISISCSYTQQTRPMCQLPSPFCGKDMQNVDRMRKLRIGCTVCCQDSQIVCIFQFLKDNISYNCRSWIQFLTVTEAQMFKLSMAKLQIGRSQRHCGNIGNYCFHKQFGAPNVLLIAANNFKQSIQTIE